MDRDTPSPKPLVHSFIHVCLPQSPKRSLRTYGEKHKVTVHGASRRRKAYFSGVRPGSPSMPSSTVLAHSLLLPLYFELADNFKWNTNSCKHLSLSFYHLIQQTLWRFWSFGIMLCQLSGSQCFKGNMALWNMKNDTLTKEVWRFWSFGICCVSWVVRNVSEATRPFGTSITIHLQQTVWRFWSFGICCVSWVVSNVSEATQPFETWRTIHSHVPEDLKPHHQ
jgi:hypothetical protein